MSTDTEHAMSLANQSITVDCCITRPEAFWFISEKDMGADYDPWSLLPSVYFLLYNKSYEDTPDGPWGWQEFGENTFKWPRAAHTETEGEMLVIGERGEVWYHGLGDNKQFEESINEKMIRGVYAIKNIHGTIYVVGTSRSVVRRDGVNQWTLISDGIKRMAINTGMLAREKGNSFDPGFDCIDGFEAHRDLYAGGGSGDVWRYDGKDWHPVDIPLPQMHIQALCCADDGYVYVAGRFGALLKGREDEWHIIRQKETEEDFRDIVCYRGTVYVCTEGRLYTVAGQKIQPVDFGDMAAPFSFSALYVNHDKLMASGSFSACIFDGETWQDLYSNSKADDITDALILNQAADQLEAALDSLSDAADQQNNQPDT